MFGKSTYLVQVAENLDEVRRKAVIGTVLELGFIRAESD